MTSALGSEERLEDMLVNDPSLVGLEVLVVGRLIITSFGGSPLVSRPEPKQARYWCHARSET